MANGNKDAIERLERLSRGSLETLAKKAGIDPSGKTDDELRKTIVEVQRARGEQRDTIRSGAKVGRGRRTDGDGAPRGERADAAAGQGAIDPKTLPDEVLSAVAEKAGIDPAGRTRAELEGLVAEAMGAGPDGGKRRDGSPDAGTRPQEGRDAAGGGNPLPAGTEQTRDGAAAGRIGELQQELADAQSQLAAAKADAERHEREAEKARKDADEARAEADRARAEAEAAQKRADDAERSAEQMSFDVLDAQKKAADDSEALENELAQARADLDAANEKATRDSAAAAEERARLADEADAARRRADDLQRELDEAQSARLDAQSQLAAAKADAERHEREAEAARKDADEARTEADRARTEAEAARTEGAAGAAEDDAAAQEAEDDEIFAKATAGADEEIDDWYNAALADPRGDEAYEVLADDYMEVAPEHVPEAWESDETAYEPIDPDSYPLTRPLQDAHPKLGETPGQARARAALFNSRALQDALTDENARLVEVRDARLRQIREYADGSLKNLASHRKSERGKWESARSWLAGAADDLRRITARRTNVLDALDEAEKRVERAEADIEREGQEATRHDASDPAAQRTFGFCGQCGAPFDSATQRFCKECGAER